MERALLSSVLTWPDELLACAEMVRPEDFYHPAHGCFWECYLAIHARRDPLDATSVAAELKRRRRYNTTEAVELLPALVALSAPYATYYAREIATHARVRRLREASKWIAAKSIDASVSADDLEAEALRRVTEALRGGRAPTMRAQSDVGIALAERIEALAAGGGHGSVTYTGLATLDDAMVGLRGGELVIVGARPAMGKTALAETIGTNVARACAASGDGVVLWFSEEMSAEEVLNRRVAGDAGVDSRQASAGIFSADGLGRYLQAINDASQLPILWHDAGRVSMMDIAQIARRTAHEHKRVALVVVDYLQRLKPINAKAEKRDQVAENAKEAKSLAKELRCPVLLLSQLNRGLETRPDKRPLMADLRESGEIEQEADAILFLYRPWVYDKKHPPHAAEVILAKMRGAEASKSLPLYFDGPRTRYRDVDEEAPAQPRATYHDDRQWDDPDEPEVPFASEDR